MGKADIRRASSSNSSSKRLWQRLKFQDIEKEEETNTKEITEFFQPHYSIDIWKLFTKGFIIQPEILLKADFCTISHKITSETKKSKDVCAITFQGHLCGHLTTHLTSHPLEFDP